MDEIDIMINRIHSGIYRFREKNADMPTHLILDIGAKQALKMRANSFLPLPRPDVETYLGIPIIDLEKVIIIDSQNSEAST